MLQSFIGTFDTAGLRSLKTEDSAPAPLAGCFPLPGQFWAVLDTDELPSIRRAMMLGQRGTALDLLLQQAKCFGSIHA